MGNQGGDDRDDTTGSGAGAGDAPPVGERGTVGDVVARVWAAIGSAKAVDVFAPVLVVTSVGARRLRLELGRTGASVNVRVEHARWVTDPPAGGERVIVVGPCTPSLAARLGEYVHIPIGGVLDVGGVDVVSCPDAAVEARVAVDALLAARAGGMAWSSMAVAVAARSSEPMLVDALRRAGVPFFGSGGRSLAQSAAGRFVLGAFEVMASGCGRRAVSALWSSVPILDPGDGSLVPVESWEYLSRRYRIVDRQDWVQLAARHTAGADTTGAKRLMAFIDDLEHTLGSDTTRGCGATLAAGLTRFLPPPGSPIGQALFGEDALAEGEAVDSVRRILAGLAAGTEELPDVAGWLVARLGLQRMQTAGRVGEGVQVGRPEVLALGRFAQVVVVGMSDEAMLRDGDALAVRRAALAVLLSPGRRRTVSVPRASSRAQREVAPFPDVLDALSVAAGGPVTADDLHAYPATVPGVRVIASWSAAVVGPHRCAPLDADDVRLATLHTWVGGGGDLLAHPDFADGAVFVRSVVADRGRRSDRWTAWDGELTDLSGWSPVERVWSVTSMETFHGCRLRLFLRDVLETRPLERPEDMADPEGRSIGSFVHKVLELLTAEFLTAELLAVEAASRPRWRDWLASLDEAHLGRVMSAAVDQLRAEGVVGRGRWWDAQVRWLQARLRHYLTSEIVHGDDFEPVAVEHGPTRDEPWVLATPVGDVRLQGRADRVERRGDELRVVDFKTGRLGDLQSVARSADPLDGGRRLQLPVYAAMHADEQRVDLGHVSGVYVNPLRPDRAKRTVMFSLSEERVAAAKAVLVDAFESMADGHFGYRTGIKAGGDDFCRWCDMAACCPVDRITLSRAKPAHTTIAIATATVATDETVPGGVVPAGIAPGVAADAVVSS